MAVRKPFRKIVVAGAEYVWKLRTNSLLSGGDRHIVVCAASRKSCLLVDPYAWELEIRPLTVASAIQFALSHGWDPLRQAPPLTLGFENGSFFVLPEGVRFAHQMRKPQEGPVLSSVGSICIPSPETLARLVLEYCPWLDALDIKRLGEAFSAILFEPGQRWEAFLRGLETRENLRNMLLARAQLYIRDVLQAPVSPETLEAVALPALDHLLFDAIPTESPAATQTTSSENG
ncbi:MAG: hypothetical protein QM784_28060 [Polyangiaceae bacterium]